MTSTGKCSARAHLLELGLLLVMHFPQHLRLARIRDGMNFLASLARLPSKHRCPRVLPDIPCVPALVRTPRQPERVDSGSRLSSSPPGLDATHSKRVIATDSVGHEARKVEVELTRSTTPVPRRRLTLQLQQLDQLQPRQRPHPCKRINAALHISWTRLHPLRSHGREQAAQP